MSQHQEADLQLVKRVQKGEQRAFDLLVLKYQQRIMSLVSRYVRDAHEVQDVTQEAFIKAYRALKGFRGDSAFYTWLYRIAINTAKNHLVVKSRRPPGSDVDLNDAEYYDGSDGLKDLENPENNLSAKRLETALYDAIQSLPEDLKTALTLREFDGLSYDDIADLMQTPIGTVRSRIFRAREAVERKINPYLERARS
jgi:RNA polymerase sigma-70 factor (ECF subfamily)